MQKKYVPWLNLSPQFENGVGDEDRLARRSGAKKEAVSIHQTVEVEFWAAPVKWMWTNVRLWSMNGNLLGKWG